MSHWQQEDGEIFSSRTQEPERQVGNGGDRRGWRNPEFPDLPRSNMCCVHLICRTFLDKTDYLRLTALIITAAFIISCSGARLHPFNYSHTAPCWWRIKTTLLNCSGFKVKRDHLMCKFDLQISQIVCVDSFSGSLCFAGVLFMNVLSSFIVN